MPQVGDSPRLIEEALPILGCQAHLEHLDRRLCVQVQVFSQIDIGEATLTQRADQAVIPKLLIHTI